MTKLVEIADNTAEIIARVSARTGLTEAEVLAEGVRVLDDESAPGGESLERWLRDEVAAGYDAYMSDPDSAISADDLMRRRSEEHTSELQSLMRISYAVFCLKKTNRHYQTTQENRTR